MNEIIRGDVVEGNQIARREDVAAYSPIVARTAINIRPATLADVAFIDSMQKKHTRELGFLPTKAIEGKIKLGEVLVAEVAKARVAYLIASDRYFKRDELGYITQINVLPEYRRSLVAGSLLQAQFDRSAYGCRLYCCWCAQDLVQANEYWEAMGFTAIAFRTGSRTKGKKGTPRMHIFWQKRVRADDATTPWWYPAHTGGGELREDRLVFPIPPGVSWRDVLPVVLPEEMNHEDTKTRSKKPRAKKIVRPPRLKGGLWFAHEAIVERVEIEPVEKAPEKKPAIDPRLKKLSRELRDHWQEQVGAGLILPNAAKHDVRRVIKSSMQTRATLALPKAA